MEVVGDSPSCIESFSLEILVHIMSFLPIKEVLRLETLSRKLASAVSIHLTTRQSIDFTEGKWYGELSSHTTDGIFSRLLQRCPKVKEVLGIHPRSSEISKRQQRHKESLSVDGITSALISCKNLEAIGTSNVQIMEAMLAIKPDLEVVGGFRNRGGKFPVPHSSRLTIPNGCKLTELILTGVAVPHLPSLEVLKILQLKWVKFTDHDPFKDFSCPNLEHFVIRHCLGNPVTASFSPLVCISLLMALGKALDLERLELVRVPFPGGMIRHVIEELWETGSFHLLTKVMIGSCKYATEVDMGYLILASPILLEELAIQPSLTKDSLFTALRRAGAEYPQFKYLHLGYVDDFPERVTYSTSQLNDYGLPEYADQDCQLTDNGLQTALKVFPSVQFVTVSYCPQLLAPHKWLKPLHSCMNLRDLTVYCCNNISIESLSSLITDLPSIEYVQLEDIFEESRQNNKDFTLSLTSLCLKSFSLGNCDIAEMLISHCTSLCYLSCSNCEILNKVQFDNTPLNKVSFCSCPSLKISNVIEEICKLPADNTRILSLQPTEEFDPVALEESIFSSQQDYHVCIMYDLQGFQSIAAKVCLYGWTDAIGAINKALLNKMNFHQAIPKKQQPCHYPWGRELFREHGQLYNGTFEFVTDFPWLRTLLSSSRTVSLPLAANRLSGSALKQLKSNISVSVCLDVLNDEIAEREASNFKLNEHLLVLYINGCDVKSIYQ